MRAGGRWCSPRTDGSTCSPACWPSADDHFELDTEAGYGDVLAARLDRFRIRVKAELERVVGDRLHVDIGEPTPPEPCPRLTNPRIGWWNGGRWLTRRLREPRRRYVRRLRARLGSVPAGRRWAPRSSRRANPRGGRCRPRGSRLHEGLLPRPGARRADGLPRFAGAPTATHRRCGRRRQARRSGRRPGRPGGRAGRRDHVGRRGHGARLREAGRRRSATSPARPSC